MCGLTGVYHFDGSLVDVGALAGMAELQRHRGPDDQGLRTFSLRSGQSRSVDVGHAPETAFEGGVAFNRLSILDLSENGHQPMCNDDETVFIAYNGECYNAFDYRDELIAKGFNLRSRSDTEIILCLYQAYGLEGTLERLNGMFALCIVDLRERAFYLVRDRLGIKPLYVDRSPGRILFSSETKSFLSHPSFNPELDDDRLDEYLLFRYCSGSGTLLRNVEQVPPGHFLRISPDGVQRVQYWSLPEPETQRGVTAGEALQQLDERLQASVDLRLLSDVPVGCQLSGGIDSSIVNLFAARAARGSMCGFSVIFEQESHTEEAWIDEAARIAGTEQQKYLLDSSGFFDRLDAATWHLDQPLNHPNSIGISYVAEGARPLVTVLLSGEGADELLCGYTRFYDGLLRDRLRPVLPLLTRFPGLARRIANGSAGVSGVDPESWFVLSSTFQNADAISALRPGAGVASAFEMRRALFDQGRGSFSARCREYELNTYLVDLLIRQDKMTMAHSMENRVPFLDHTLVEYIQSLPASLFVQTVARHPRYGRRHHTKRLLKSLAEKYFPSSFVYRPKMGFGIPLTDFFTDRHSQEFIEDRILPRAQERDIFSSSGLRQSWQQAQAGSGRACESFWICMAFELWAQTFLDRQGRAAHTRTALAPG